MIADRLKERVLNSLLPEVLISLASLIFGYLIAALTLIVAYHFAARYKFSGGTTLKGALIFCIPGSFLGWCLFLLPLALSWLPNRSTDSLSLMPALAVLVGAAMTWFETFPLGQDAGSFSFRDLYILSGALEAIVATTVLILLLRGADRRIEKPI